MKTEPDTQREPDPSDLVVIHWRSMRTGQTGHGSPMTRALADAWLDSLHGNEHGIDHWTQPA